MHFKLRFILLANAEEVTRSFSVKALFFKVQSCQLCNNKYIASSQITNTEIFAFIAALVFRLLSREVLIINKKNIRQLTSRLLFKKVANSTGNTAKLETG